MIPKRYILYLDILGFSELAKTPGRVLDLYQIVDRLNVHRHHAFRCLVFSDTMIVYNIHEPRTAHDRQYHVMYLAEFAQDLLYRLIGREYYFRAVLTQGEFLHKRLENLDAFFGQALIDAYRDEKNLKGCGLFIDARLLGDNKIFPTCPHCDRFHYVFLTQDIERANEYGQNGFPFPGRLLDSTSMNFPTYAQLVFLKDVYAKSREHPDLKVRSKFEATWDFFYAKFQPICDALCESGFDFRAIADADWDSARVMFERELKSDYYKYDGNKFINGDGK